MGKHKKPKHGQPYWMINSRWQVKSSDNTQSNKAKGRIAAGNYFETKKEAEEFVEALKDMRAGKLQVIGPKLRKQWQEADKVFRKRPWWAFWRVK